MKLWQHNFTIATVVKLLTKGLSSESGLHSLPSRSSRYPCLGPEYEILNDKIWYIKKSLALGNLSKFVFWSILSFKAYFFLKNWKVNVCLKKREGLSPNKFSNNGLLVHNFLPTYMIFFHLSPIWFIDLCVTTNCVFCWSRDLHKNGNKIFQSLNHLDMI